MIKTKEELANKIKHFLIKYKKKIIYYIFQIN